jgi:hypothetical protein
MLILEQEKYKLAGIKELHTSTHLKISAIEKDIFYLRMTYKCPVV